MSVKSERTKYDRVWLNPVYRRKAHGVELWNNYRHVFPEPVTSALDIGCGHGRLFALWNESGIDGYGVDISGNGPDPEIRQKYPNKFQRACLSRMNWHRRFDLGVSADVLEHLPTEIVRPALERIWLYCECSVHLIANFGSHAGNVDLHPTVKPAEWWIEQMQDVGGVVRQFDWSGPRPKHLLRWDAR